MAKRLKTARSKAALLKRGERRRHTGKKEKTASRRRVNEEVLAEEEIGSALRSFAAGTEKVW